MSKAIPSEDLLPRSGKPLALMLPVPPSKAPWTLDPLDTCPPMGLFRCIDQSSSIDVDDGDAATAIVSIASAGHGEGHVRHRTRPRRFMPVLLRRDQVARQNNHVLTAEDPLPPE